MVKNHFTLNSDEYTFAVLNKNVGNKLKNSDLAMTITVKHF